MQLKNKVVYLLVFLLIPFKSYALCANPEQSQALALRALKSSLMVAALSCNQQKPYNTFIKKHEDTLSSAGNTVQKLFTNHYGSQAKYQLNKFMTHIANTASKLSMSSSDEYCDTSAKLFKKINKSNNYKFLAVVKDGDYHELHGIKSCSSNVTIAQKDR